MGRIASGRTKGAGCLRALSLLLIGLSLGCASDESLTGVALPTRAETPPLTAALSVDPAYMGPIDLGLLPGAVSSEAVAVSNWGVVLVTNYFVGPARYETAYSIGGGPQIPIGHLPGAPDTASTWGADINASGVIVGVSAGQAFRKLPGQPLEALSGVGASSVAMAINGNGMITGYSRFGPWVVPWRWINGAVQWLWLPSGPSTQAYAIDINDSGVVLGHGGQSKTYRWGASGRPVQVAQPSRFYGVQGTALNNAGTVVGVGYPHVGQPEGLAWYPRGYYPSTLGSGAHFWVADVNGAGRIVGRRDTQLPYVTQAWVRSGSTMYDLPTTGAWSPRSEATALNSCGWAAGTIGTRAVLWKRYSCG